MSLSEQPAPRGRPRTITRERIAEAGIKVGLPNITFAGLASVLGVSHMALYKHVPTIEDLKRLVAEEIFTRWRIPQASGNAPSGLKDYLITFTASVRDFVQANPGVTPYVIRRLAATQPMITKIIGHQKHIAHAYALTDDESRWLLATVTFNCLAVADVVYSVGGKAPLSEEERAAERAEMEGELDQGVQALIVGALVMLEDNRRTACM